MIMGVVAAAFQPLVHGLMDESDPFSCLEQVSVKLQSSGYGRAVTLEIAVENV